MKIAIACDHAGLDLKDAIKAAFPAMDFLDLGTNSAASVDYPDYAAALAGAVEDGRAERGILICGSGIGISIAANRFSHIRAALCMNSTMARLSRQHNDANVLALGSRLIGAEIAFDCVRAFLDTGFEGGRHCGRVDKLKTILDH